MPFLHTSVTLDHASGFAEDAVVNTFNIIGFSTDDEVSVAQDVHAALANFYNVQAAGAGSPLANLLSRGLSRAAGGMRIRSYDVTGKLGINPATGRPYPHGSPVHESAHTLGASAGAQTPLPEEVALCVTLRGFGWEEALAEAPDGGDAGSAPDRPRQRLTGRFYLGPFNIVAIGNDLVRCRPSDTLITAAGAAVQMLETELANNGHHLAVWSRTDGVMWTVTDVQVDNAWDTQRRRGHAPTSRTTVPIG